MTACTLCGGYGSRHDPIAHDAEPLADWERELICRHCGASCCNCCNGDGGIEP